jgi:hypothetical protein
VHAKSSQKDWFTRAHWSLLQIASKKYNIFFNILSKKNKYIYRLSVKYLTEHVILNFEYFTIAKYSQIHLFYINQ